MLTCPACGRTSPSDASFCAGCGVPLGATATTREARKTVTALFCDLVGSTALGETHDPEVLRPALDRYFAEVRGAVEHHGGRVEKFVGDAVNAVFGLPSAHEDDALRAVRAAVEIGERLATVAASSAIPLGFRIGIATGEVLVPGDGRPLIGDAMNVAARLQAAADPGAIIVGEPTWRLVRDAVTAEAVAPLSLKGKAGLVAAYRVSGVTPLSHVATRHLDAPMVGREREAAALTEALARAASDRACVLVTIVGEAGAGKSRLVEEFTGGRGREEAEILRGRCLPYGEGITWHPLTEALRGALDLPEFADATQRQDAIHAAVGAEESAPAIEANLSRLFAAAGEGGTLEETFWAIRRFLEMRGRDRPVVLVLDDIHRGEPTFLDCVEHVADWCRDASILLLCMARPDLLDVRPDWGEGRPDATTIALSPLSDTECGALIAGLLGSSTPPEPVRARIAAVAEGNPLFVEETIRMLVDDGRLMQDGEAWVVSSDLSELAVPPTIAALLAARLDRLSADERAVIGAAAVEGKVFHRGALEALAPEDVRPEVPRHLRSLVRRDLVAPEGSTLAGADAYRFGHQLVRDAAYDAIPKAARATLHEAFADWLEAAAGEGSQEYEEILGFHLGEACGYAAELLGPGGGAAELGRRAAAHLRAAAKRARDRGDSPAAVRLYLRAETLTGQTEAALPLIGCGLALFDVGRTSEALERAERALGIAAATDDRRAAALARLLRVDVAVAEGMMLDTDPAAAAEVETALTDAALSADPLALALAWQAQGRQLYMVGRFVESSECTRIALGHARAADDVRIELDTEIDLVIQAIAGPTPAAEVAEMAEALIATTDPYPAVRADALRLLAVAEAMVERDAQALAHASESIALYRDLGQPASAANARADRSWVYRLAGDLERAEVDLRDALDETGAAGDSTFRAFVSCRLAQVMMAEGRYGEATPYIDEADRVPVVTNRSRVLGARARIKAAAGDRSAADDVARLVAMVEDSAFVNVRIDGLVDAAEAMALLGDDGLSRRYGREALRLALEKGNLAFAGQLQRFGDAAAGGIDV